MYGTVFHFRFFFNTASFECETCSRDIASLGFRIFKKSDYNFCFTFLARVSGRWQVAVSRNVNADPCVKFNEALFLFSEKTGDVLPCPSRINAYVGI